LIDTCKNVQTALSADWQIWHKLRGLSPRAKVYTISSAALKSNGIVAAASQQSDFLIYVLLFYILLKILIERN
jgi:hypothetical protein